jgi:TctA family transporter
MDEYKQELKENIEKLYDPFTFKLTGKIGAILGAGIGYLGGLVGGAIKDLLLNELPYLLSGLNTKEIIFHSFTYGSQVASEIALVGAGVGAVIAKLCTRKRDDFVYVEEEV